MIIGPHTPLKFNCTSHHLQTGPKSVTWPISLGADFYNSFMQNEAEFLQNQWRCLTQRTNWVPTTTSRNKLPNPQQQISSLVQWSYSVTHHVQAATASSAVWKINIYNSVLQSLVCRKVKCVQRKDNASHSTTQSTSLTLQSSSVRTSAR